MGVIIGCLYDNGNGVVKRKKINKGITDTEEVMGEKVLEQVFEQEGRDEIQGTDVGSLLQIREQAHQLLRYNSHQELWKKCCWREV